MKKPGLLFQPRLFCITPRPPHGAAHPSAYVPPAAVRTAEGRRHALSSAPFPYDQQAFSPSSKKPSVSCTKPFSSICRHVAVPLAPWFPVMESYTVGGNC